jgi:hypothetical protein
VASRFKPQAINMNKPESVKTYRYKPLPENFIRLLAMETDPGRSSPDNLFYSTSLAGTTEKLHYHCLSYT